jgi:hypothetical protein
MRSPALLMSICVSFSLLAATGCENLHQAKYKAAIEKALQEDALTGTDPTDLHTTAMHKVDLSDCPEDFRTAYVKHIHAWEDKAKVHQAQAELDDQESDADAVAEKVATLFGTDDSLWKDHVAAVKELDKLEWGVTAEVKATLRDVEEIAGRYGARRSQ